MKGINKDVTREKCVHDDNGNVTGESNAGETPYQEEENLLHFC